MIPVQRLLLENIRSVDIFRTPNNPPNAPRIFQSRGDLQLVLAPYIENRKMEVRPNALEVKRHLSKNGLEKVIVKTLIFAEPLEWDELTETLNKIKENLKSLESVEIGLVRYRDIKLLKNRVENTENILKKINTPEKLSKLRSNDDKEILRGYLLPVALILFVEKHAAGRKIDEGLQQKLYKELVDKLNEIADIELVEDDYLKRSLNFILNVHNYILSLDPSDRASLMKSSQYSIALISTLSFYLASYNIQREQSKR